MLSDTDATFTAASWGPQGGSTTTFNVGPVSSGTGNSLNLSIAPVSFVGATNMTFNVTGSSGDRLILTGGDLQFANIASESLILNPTTANLTVSKNINQPNSGKTATLKLDGSSASNLFSGNITNGGGTLAVTKSNSSTWALSGTNTYSGTTSITGGTLAYRGASAMSSNSSLSPSSGVTLSLLSDTDATFNAAGFGPGGGATVTLNVGPVSTGSGNSLTLNSSAVTFVGSNSMTFNVTGSSSDRLILSGGDLNFTGGTGQSLLLNPTTANLTVSKNMNDPNSGGTGLLTLDGTSASNLFSGNITNSTGTVSVTKSNSSTWTLAGNNTYTGNTTVSVGTLVLSGANNNGSTATTSVSNGATLQLQANNGNTSNFTTASTALGAASGKLSLANGSTLQLRSDTNVTFNGTDALGGLNGLTITIDVNNITAGTTNGATNGGTQNQTLSLASATTVIGTTGQFNITGGDGYTLAFGPLQTGNGTGQTETFNPTSASVTIASYNNGTGASNTLALAGTSTGNAVLGAIANSTGSLALTKSGASTWTLTGANTYGGATTISAGTLQLGNGGATGSLSTSSTITDNGIFVINRSNAVSQGTDFSTAAITGAGGFTQAGSGATTLNVANTFSGLTTVSAGELDLNATAGQAIAGNLTVSGGTAKLLQASQINSAKNLVVSGGTFNLQGFNQTMAGVQLVSGSISGSGGTLTSTSDFDMQSGSVSAKLAGSVGLTKTTGGTVTLSGANTYNGATTVSAGALNFAGSGSLGSVSVADSATLGAKLSSTSASVVAATNLTFGTSGPSTFALDFNSLSNPSVAVVALSGTLTVNGTVNLSLANAGNLSSATNSLQLISYNSRSGTGAFNLTTTSAGHTAFALNDTATALYLNVTAATNFWTGTTSNSWDIGAPGGGSGSHNWSLSDQVYLEGDIVAFDDSASQYNVNIASAVSPSSVTFSNSNAHAYTLSGAGIGGSSVLTLNGTNGTVILTNTNTYTGITTIGSGDTLQLGDGTTDGTITNSASITDNGTLIYNRLTGSSFTYGNVISGTGSLTKSGSGTQILSGANTYTVRR